ncbi:hypothetical protein SCHPADRAFT_883672 [Schizopora paradoxa]|uniref:Uncharacterized protein n=1 Tax=Schizopora paradoxa TaxID=27342 RepID=A0A0H2R2Q1_9AGAM|nr:hypothetical protein SCHPADRAFT_883672 [Schizopora paradoxa]
MFQTTMWRGITVTVAVHWQLVRVVLLALSTSSVCLGQGDLFQWKFNAGNPSSLTACSNYSISVISASGNASALGKPPYFMVAFLPSGIPTKSFIGTDPSNLTWFVDQPTGSPLLLSVTDGQGDSGGQPSIFLTVVGSNDTSCLPSPPSEKVIITTNFTSPITSCQALGMQISGGKKPYTLTLTAVNSPVLTNVSMGAEDDTFTYINRADPGGQLMASVSDANGIFAQSTQLYQTTGSTDVSCPGLVSSSSKSAPPPKGRSSPAIPIAISLVVALVLLAAAIGFVWRRRQRAKRYNKAGAAILPDVWVGPSSTPGSETEALALDMRDNSRSLGDSKRAAAAANSPVRYRDADESGSSRSLLPGEQSATDSPDVVIQHRDGGRVQEIPPPYFDHDSIEGTSSGSMSPSNTTERMPMPKGQSSRGLR